MADPKTQTACEENPKVGSGGFSARAGFLFSLNLFPGVMLAMGLIEVLSFYGALIRTILSTVYRKDFEND